MWGTLAAGGLFSHATVVAGRQPPHARERGLALVKQAHATIMQAELATRSACDAVLAAQPTDPPELAAQLRAAAMRWAELAPGEQLTFELPGSRRV